MIINTTPLRKSIASLVDALDMYRNDPDELYRDGCIQRFEYTYDLSHKMIKRYLQETEPNPDEIAVMTFQQLIRIAYERNLIPGEWAEWKKYRDMRNKTSHGYDADIARAVFKNVPDFLNEAQQLLAELEQRNAQNDQ